VKVLAVGDCGVDRYVDIRADRPGGISLNFAVNARNLFEPEDEVGVLTVLGNDSGAGVVEQAIAEHGLGSSIAYGADITPVQFIDRDETGERIFVRYDAGAMAAHRLTADEQALMQRSDVVIAAIFNQVVDYFETVADAPANALRALDYGNPGPPEDPLAYMRRYTERFDIGFVGLGPELRHLLGEVEALARDNKKVIVATLGAEGSVTFSADKPVRCAAVRVDNVVDTTGAGDTFAAGFLSVYAKGGDVSAAMERGAMAASGTVAQFGAFAAEFTPWPENYPAEWDDLRHDV